MPNESTPLRVAFRDVKTLYLMHLSFSLVSRMWEMGIVLFIAEITGNSLMIVAVAGFVSSFSIFMFMSSIGRWLDHTDRMVAARVTLISKLVVVSLAYLLCDYLIVMDPATSGLRSFLLYALPVLCALAAICFATITQSIEKDWLVVLSNGDSDWLTRTNSVMSQIDLGCNTVGPAITGFIFTSVSLSTTAFILLGLNAAVTFSFYVFMQHLYVSWPALEVKSSQALVRMNTMEEVAVEGAPSKKEAAYNSLEDVEKEESEELTSAQSWKRFYCLLSEHSRLFVESQCFRIMFAYAMLYFTVLSFSSLMIVYLRWCGLSDHWIGIFRGAASLTGFLGATIFPAMKDTFGLDWAGLIAIAYQCILVVFAASSFYWLDRYGSMLVIVWAVLLSRTGLWLFDLCARQIAQVIGEEIQERILEHVRGVVNGQWRAIVAFFDMSSYLVAMAVSDPSEFWVLTTVSASMVTLSALIVWSTILCPPLTVVELHSKKCATKKSSNVAVHNNNQEDEENQVLL